MARPFRESLAMRLRVAYLAMHRAFQEHFAPFGVTADQFVVLSLLAEEDGIIQRALASRAGSDANTITAILRLLEQKELVRREPRPGDTRARCVYLTTEGRRLQRELAFHSAELHRRLDRSVPSQAHEALLSCLDDVAESMSAARQCAPPSPGDPYETLAEVAPR